ncbi:MAG: integrase core domain-containing protein [Alphaproteobacteria bacterium]|nr:integrase core domain-containing protein [Alphaproteobacteria bacterium]
MRLIDVQFLSTPYYSSRQMGTPEIFNTDQGSQFTSFDFTNVLKENGIKISMDWKSRWIDNVFIERLWRSLKYECVYLNAFETGIQARKEIGAWMSYYNQTRPHSTFNGQTPDEVYKGHASHKWKEVA